jgi:tyrosyl-tRNA synthetase
MQNPIRSPFLKTMHERGFFNQCTDEAALDRKLGRGPITAYVGFDATADSLHIGHLVSLMSMRHLAAAGHRVIALVGGATSKVGDPSFRTASRPMMDDATISANIAGISANIRAVLSGFEDSVLFVDNADWLGSVGLLDFMRDVGVHFTVARMLAMESVRSRLDEQNPLTLLEFVYMSLQSADFAELARRHGCVLQMGGSDQWGNITAGIDLARRTDGAELLGLTTKLLTTSDGRKMGKTANGAVWLSSERLAPFDFWQFWRSVDDADVERFLLLFTELTTDEIAVLVSSQETVNTAKERLATEVTALVHGQAAALSCGRKAAALFAGTPSEPTHRLEVSGSMPLAEALARMGFATSRSEARRLVAGGGVRIGDRVVVDPLEPIAAGVSLPLSIGKRRKALVEVVEME